MIHKIIQSLIPTLRNIYIKSPINFSTLTGWRYPGIPRLKGNFLLGRLTTLFKENGALENIIEAGKLAEKHPSGICYFWLGKQLAILLTRPEDIQALKVKCEENLSRDLPLMRETLGASLFTDNKENWRKKREACKKFLSHEEVEKLKPHMEKIIKHHIKSLENYKDQPIELRTFFFNLVVDVVTINLMGCPANSSHQNAKKIQPSEISHYLSVTLHDVFQFRNIFKAMLPGFIRKLFFPKTESLKTLKERMHHQYQQLFLSPNRDHIFANENIIKEIWQINHQNQERYDNNEISGDGIALLGAGVATTVATLEFIIKLLAAHPDKKEILRAEIQRYPQEEITLEILKQMTYLEMIIKETMRLYPPAPLLMPREIEKITEINGITLFKGDTPIFSPYVTHRLKTYWDEPEKFIPERFSKENQQIINPNAYFPFSLGPRFCLGQQFAMQEMKLIIIFLYKNYDIEIQNNSFAITLRQGGLAAAIPPVVRLIE